MTSQTPVCLAVVGCGAVAERFHLPAIQQVSGVRLCALVEKDPEHLRRLGRKYPGARLYRDVEELSSDTDAAIVAVPNALHAPVAINLLRRGIHVLCEKPMATTVEACKEMVQVSGETGFALMIGHHKRFVPSVRKAKDLLDDGRLGRINCITGSIGLRRTWRSRTSFHLDHSLAGGGVLIDNGVHLIDLVRWLVGQIEVLRCNLVPEHVAVEEEAKVEFRTGSDAHGVLRFSNCRALPNILRVEGDEGFLEFDTFDYPSLKLFLRSTALCRSSGAIALKWPQTSPYVSQLEHFVRFLTGKEPRLLNCGEESVENIAFVTKAYNEARRSFQ